MTDGFQWGEFVPDQRDSLLDDVQHGRLTPEQAEAEAARLGLEPLANVPDPSAFNPLNRPLWSVPMTLAWIALRDIDAVRQCWNEYRLARSDWQPIRRYLWPDLPENGKTLEVRKPARDLTVDVVIATRGRRDVSAGGAWDTMVEQLRLGNIQADAIDFDSGKATSIAQVEWKVLRPSSIGRQFIVAGGGRRYYDVEIRRDALLKIWPGQEVEVGVTHSSSGPIDPGSFMQLPSVESAAGQDISGERKRRMSDSDAASLADQIAADLGDDGSQQAFVKEIRDRALSSGHTVDHRRARVLSNLRGVTKERGRPVKLTK